MEHEAYICGVTDCDQMKYNNNNIYCSKHLRAYTLYGDPLFRKYGYKKKNRDLVFTTHPAYVNWQSMKRRVLNPKASDYKSYGALGIKICDHWINSFENFLEDMGEKPDPSFTLDRIDPSGNYEPSNCRWASKYTQSQNKKARGSSGTIGVHYSSSKDKWIAKLVFNKQVYHISYHNTEKSAKLARLNAEKNFLQKVTA